MEIRLRLLERRIDRLERRFDELVATEDGALMTDDTDPVLMARDASSSMRCCD
jgi:hypothetical protein